MKIMMKIIMRGDYAGCSVSFVSVIQSQEQKKVATYKLWEQPGKTTDYIEKRHLSKYSLM